MAQLTAILANISPDADHKSFVYRRGSGSGGSPDPKAMRWQDLLLFPWWQSEEAGPVLEEGTPEWWAWKGKQHAEAMQGIMAQANAFFQRHPHAEVN